MRHGVGQGASHLLSGHSAVHERLEAKLAEFMQMPRALLFSTGYQANIGAVTALAGPEDAIFSDALNHASLIDGVRLSRARVVRYPHADLGFLSGALAESDARTKLIVTDGVFSMDGDIAPLPAVLDLCERHDAWLLVDDAHGFGVIGLGGGVDHLAARAGVLAAAAQRVVRLGRGEPLVDQPDRDRSEPSGQVRREFPGHGRGRALAAG